MPTSNISRRTFTYNPGAVHHQEGGSTYRKTYLYLEFALVMEDQGAIPMKNPLKDWESLHALAIDAYGVGCGSFGDQTWHLNDCTVIYDGGFEHAHSLLTEKAKVLLVGQKEAANTLVNKLRQKKSPRGLVE